MKFVYTEKGVGSSINLNYVMAISAGTNDEVGSEYPYAIIFTMNNDRNFAWDYKDKADRDIEITRLLKYLDF